MTWVMVYSTRMLSEKRKGSNNYPTIYLNVQTIPTHNKFERTVPVSTAPARAVTKEMSGAWAFRKSVNTK